MEVFVKQCCRLKKSCISISDQLQITDCVPSQTLVATVETQTLVINLTLASQYWYITTHNPVDSINITVTDVKIGTGYSGLVDKCQTDFVRVRINYMAFDFILQVLETKLCASITNKGIYYFFE